MAIAVFLLYDYCEQNMRPSYRGWITDGVMASSYPGSRGSTSFWFLCSFPHNPITHAQIKHIWVYPVYILPDMADMATTETSKLEDIDIIICIRANFLGLYSVGSSWWSLDRSDTLEHCLICVSFNYFYMISVLKFIFTQEQTLFVRLKSFFFLQCWRSGKLCLYHDPTKWVWN